MAKITVAFSLDDLEGIEVQVDGNYDLENFRSLICELVAVRNAIDSWIGTDREDTNG